MRRSNTRDLSEILKEIGLEVTREQTKFGQEYLAIKIPKDNVEKLSTRTPYVVANGFDASLYEFIMKNGVKLYFQEIVGDKDTNVVIKQNDAEIGRIPKSIIQGLDDDGNRITLHILEMWKRGRRRRV